MTLPYQYGINDNQKARKGKRTPKKAKKSMFRSEKLKKFRKEKELSQTDTLFGLHIRGIRISHQTLINWESGKTTPNAIEVAVLAEVFEKPVGKFFDAVSYLS